VQSFSCAEDILVLILKIFVLDKNERNFIPWASGNTGLIPCNGLQFEPCTDQICVVFVHFLFYYLSPKFSLFLILKYRLFFTSKKYLQKPL
jgi:hypothetical protein